VDQAAAAAPLRIVVNCAGLGWAGRVVNRDGSPHDLGAFQFVVNVNLIGTFNGMRLGAAAIAKTDPVNDDGARGVIVNTASIAALVEHMVENDYLNGEVVRLDGAIRMPPK